MFFNKILVTNPDPSVLEKKIDRTTLDIYYMASLLEEDLLDAEEDETAEEVSAALKELESALAVMRAEHEAVVAIQKYFFVKEAAEAQSDSDVQEDETLDEYFAVCSDLEVVEEDVPESEDGERIILSDADMRILEELHGQSRSKLYQHAARELEIRGDDQDFVDMFLNMITCFCSYGHSGSSAEHSTQTLERLLRFKNLTELTDDPTEWLWAGNGLWQNQRNFQAFTNDPHFRDYWMSDAEGTYFKTKRVMENPEPEGPTD